MLRKGLEDKYKKRVQKKESRQGAPDMRVKVPKGTIVKDGRLMANVVRRKDGSIRGGEILAGNERDLSFRKKPKGMRAGGTAKKKRAKRMGGGMMKKRMKRGGRA